MAKLIEDVTGNRKSIIHRILTEDFKKKKVCINFVLYSLNDDHKSIKLVSDFKKVRRVQQSSLLAIATDYLMQIAKADFQVLITITFVVKGMLSPAMNI